MSIVLSNAGKPVLLDLERTTLNGYWIGLYKSNTTPVGSTVMGDLTEVTDVGYTATGRQHPAFTAASLNGSSQGELDAPTLTWTMSHDSGDYTIYGYFVSTASSGGTLIYSERAPAPFTVTASGQTYSVVPKKIMDTY